MNIRVDESLYGIADYIEKNSSKRIYKGAEQDNHKENPDNSLLTGTAVMTGGGKALVCSVGKNTLLARRRNQEKVKLNLAKTFLESKLEESCDQISKYCFIATIIIALLATINMFIMLMVEGKDLWSNKTLLQLIEIWILAICILIVAIPDGMPIAISLAMALSISGLKKSNILIKNLESI